MPKILIRQPEQLVDPPTADADPRPPIHVCVSGLTGAGKSTVLHRVSTLVAAERRNVVVLDERSLHHPYLDRLFVEPDTFAFELQIQFMIARALFVKRWWSAGYSLVMERSHAEDPVFIRHLRSSGIVTSAESDAYMAVWAHLDARTPPPDLVLYLDVAPSVSIDRLDRDERPGHRPPFADDASKHAWVTSWHSHYQDRIEELRSDHRFADAIITFTGTVNESRLPVVVRAAFTRLESSASTRLDP